MSAESRSLLPDWHQRPVRWKVEDYFWNFTLLGDLHVDKDEMKRLYTNVIPLEEGKPHRRSSCLTEYEPGTTIDPGVFKW